jgi:hypothetical protein
MERRQLMKTHFILVNVMFLASGIAWSTEEGMPSMPRIQSKKTYTVPTENAGKELLEQRGYGDQEPMVRMMNLMMVGGSGYEGMDMSEMSDHDMKAHGGPEEHAHHTPPPVPKPAEGQTATYDFDMKVFPSPPKVGTNSITIRIQCKNEAKPAHGLKIKAQIYMTSMDMGIEEPNVSEIEAGRYKLKAIFSMKGPWAVKLLLPEGGEKVFTFKVGS